MLLYGIPIVLSAFLLFLIQPMIGKFILPWFGGSPSVWTTCMLFFQVMLLCGYAYAHISISCLKPRTQGLLHLTLLLAAVVALPVIPSEIWKPDGPDWAEVGILVLLTATIGLPLFVLSATAPLLQAWFGRQYPGVSPYGLYAFSNGASLAGLISYPFIIEPAIRLKTQGWAWSAGFGCFAMVCGWCAVRQFTVGMKETAIEEDKPMPLVPRLDSALWVGWSACGSVMLLATTSQLTQDVAVVPMLWVIPLALYLLSFVICFAGTRWYWRPMWLVAFPLAIIGLTTVQPLSLMTQIYLYCGTLFIACMICHGELFRLKPAAAALTVYYLFISIGGALGGIVCSLVAPLAFSGFWEYPFGIAAICLLLIVRMVRELEARWRFNPTPAWIAVFALTVIALVGFVVRVRDLRDGIVVTVRSFYGVLSVGERVGDHGPERMLFHGQVWHGVQFFSDNLRRSPVAYYGPTSGLGLAASVLRDRDGEGKQRLRIGAIGLGAGVVAAYGRKDDDVHFYEINPDVVSLAREYFTYLIDTPARVAVVLGDARLSLERERATGKSQQFDLLVLDAFSGDAVPLHLLTREAFMLYDHHLAPGGILAVNISNQLLDMTPLIFGLARDGSRWASLIVDPHEDDSIQFNSRWVLVARDEFTLKNPAVVGRAALPGDPSGWMCFTDDYSNLFQLVNKVSASQ